MSMLGKFFCRYHGFDTRLSGKPTETGSTVCFTSCRFRYRVSPMRFVHSNVGVGVQMCSMVPCVELNRLVFGARNGSGRKSLPRPKLKRAERRLLSVK